MSAQHTPGPWLLHHEPTRDYADWTDHGGYRIDADGIEQLAFVWERSRRIPLNGHQSDGPEFGTQQAEADARLIAEAPNLLAALEWALLRIGEPRLVRGQNDAFYAAYHRARAAIVKATGAA